MLCRACGDQHEDGAQYCPRLGDRTDRGPCGTQIDRYAVERLLGGGGMGAVYLAKHTMLGSSVALKLLKGDLAGKQDMVDRFVREARAAAAIGSPHIVRVTDVGTTPDGSPFLVMELLNGQDLDGLLKERGTLAPLEAIDVTLQVLDGLAAAHAAGIVHRDLKPANIYLVPDPKSGKAHVKIVDFGISKMHKDGAASSLTRTGVMMGTPMYMAPEQLKSARDVDHRVDLYAAAVTLYQMVSGTLPYEATSYETLIVQIFTEAPKPIRRVAAGLNEALARVIEKGMNADPAQRYHAAAEFDAALRLAVAALGGAPALQLVHTRPDAQQIAYEQALIAQPSAAPALAPAGPSSVSPTGPTAQGVVPAPERKGGGKTWLWVLLGILVLGGGGFGIFAAVRARQGVAEVAVIPDATVAPVAAPAPPKPVESKPDAAPPSPPDAAPEEKPADEKDPPKPVAAVDEDEDDVELEEKPEPEPEEEEKPEPPPPPPQVGGDFEIDEPRIVGDLSGAPLRKAFKAARTDLDDCRPKGKSTTVEVQFHVHTKITLAAAAPDNQGDAKVARCVAARIKEQNPTWPDGSSGIIFVVVGVPGAR